MRIVQLLLIAIAACLEVVYTIKCFQCKDFVCGNDNMPEEPDTCHFPEQQYCVAFIGTGKYLNQVIRGCGTLSPLGLRHQCNVTVVGLKQIGCWHACDTDGCNHKDWPEPQTNETQNNSTQIAKDKGAARKDAEKQDSQPDAPEVSSGKILYPNWQLIVATQILLTVISNLYF